VEWTWTWTVGNDAYSFGDNPVIDSLRIVCVVGGVVLAVAILGVLREMRHRDVYVPRTQQLRFVALGLADVYISFTEVAVLGSPGTPRLVVGLLCLLSGALGVHGMREKQKRQPLKD